MDHALKEALLKLAGKLLSPTRSLEGSTDRYFRQSVHEMAADQSLEAVVRGSMPAFSAPNVPVFAADPGTSPASSPALSPAARPPAIPPPAPAVTTGRSEYRAALQDQSVVAALLALAHQQGATPATARAQGTGRAPADAAQPTPAPPREAPPAFGRASPPQVSAEPARFAHADFPCIEVEPKRAGSFRRSPSLAQSILRPRT